MNTRRPTHISVRLAALAAVLCVIQTGCVQHVKWAVPAYRMPCEFMGELKDGKVPIDFTLLRQNPPESHIIGPQDVLGIYINGILPPKIDDAPVVQPPVGFVQLYYPPRGVINVPNLGIPVTVQPAGTLDLPLVDPIKVAGMTIPEAAEVIRGAYADKGMIQAGRERILLTLQKSRVKRVMVLREDTEQWQVARKDQYQLTKKGTAHVIDLPAFENDVLHALTASGGLPGIDTYNEVWVYRNTKLVGADMEMLRSKVLQTQNPEEMARLLCPQSTLVRIPLKVFPGEPLPFDRDDVVLNEGDVLYLVPRVQDYFYVGGLLAAGEIPLPRDRDIDILEALAIANGAVGAPAGVGGAAQIFRSGAGPGNIVPPTQCLIIRKLPNGQTVGIRCDLVRATRDNRERVVIQPQDYVFLFYKPAEQLTNVLLNLFNLNFNVIYTP